MFNDFHHLYQVIVVTLFVATIALLALERLERHVIAVVAIAVLLLTQAISLDDFLHFVDWDVIGLILCMSVYSVILEVSGFGKLIAYRAVARVKNPLLLLYVVILLSGVVSLVLENTITVFVFAPMAFEIASILGVSAKEVLIGIALTAGMAGSATMVGDPPAIIVAGHYNLAFTDFFVYKSRPSMFFIVIIPMLIATALYVLQNYVHRGKRDVNTARMDEGSVDKWFVLEASLFLFLKIALLSLRKELGIPLTLSAIVALAGLYITRVAVHRDIKCIEKSLKEGLDYKLPLFLVAIFLLSNSLKKHGVTDSIANLIIGRMGGNILALGVAIFIISAVLSAFIENIPVTLTLLPIVDSIAVKIGVDPLILAWGTLSGLTAGGGYTYIGSGANVVAMHILGNKNIKTGFADFIKTALSFNIANTVIVIVLYTSIWLL
uniref:Citrate transporter n=1 Tax=Ignisphaera aggregans TaxID=334771 RepID=A0A7C4FHW2_9CREN